MKNVKQIVKKYLKENGYTALVGDNCGCSINDLMPCDYCVPSCQAAYNCKFYSDHYCSKKKCNLKKPCKSAQEQEEGE